jgi:hypothetical protein
MLLAGSALGQEDKSIRLPIPRPKIERLERNVRLDFAVVPLEEGDQGVFLVTASSRYETGVQFKGKDGRVVFEATGTVKILEDDQVFVTVRAHLFFRGGEGEGNFQIDSSAILKPGKSMEIARMGEKTLVVKASYVD